MQAVHLGHSLVETSIEISKFINTWRNIVMEIRNCSNKYILTNPRVYTSSGYCDVAPQPTIEKSKMELCSFTNTARTARGSVGVLMYKISTDDGGSVGELAIMFSVPFDYNLYKNWFALGVFDKGTQCNYELFSQMYYNKGSFTRAKSTGSEISYTGKNVKVKGAMTPAGRSIMKVELWDE